MLHRRGGGFCHAADKREEKWGEGEYVYGDCEDINCLAAGDLQYAIDQGDDWQELSAWVKANPNYGVSLIMALGRATVSGGQEQSVYEIVGRFYGC